MEQQPEDRKKQQEQIHRSKQSNQRLDQIFVLQTIVKNLETRIEDLQDELDSREFKLTTSGIITIITTVGAIIVSISTFVVANLNKINSLELANTYLSINLNSLQGEVRDLRREVDELQRQKPTQPRL